MSPLPIIVDLDRTLIKTDSLHEQMVRAFFSSPLDLAGALAHLPRGRAAFKAELARRTPSDGECPPLREPLVQYLKEQHARGREIHLCTAADQTVADQVGAKLGIFTSIQGSSGINLKGKCKARHLGRRFPGGHVYAGDSAADLDVWKEASGVILAGASPSTTRRAKALAKPIEAEFPPERASLHDWIRELRIHHWSKNTLIFLPMILGHAWSWGNILLASCALVLLLVVTSSTYILNDLADLQADRKHWSKRARPIAAGKIPVMTAAIVAAAGLFLGLSLSFLLPWRFALSLCGYTALTLAYSAGLKRIPFLDTFIIAVLFSTRLLMGVSVIGISYSVWLFTFSLFFFFSLATAKRYTELLRAKNKGAESLAGRGYNLDDTPMALMFGAGAALASLQVLVLYLVEDAHQKAHYSQPKFLWLMPLLVAIWLGRVWLLAHRGRMHDDPVSFALRDMTSLALGLVVALAYVAAL